ncbi:Coriolopsis Gallica laccase collected At 8.98 Kev [Sistotremastrum niveocremeum HHB9708]|uniref:Coriolopsis Gallica laccase collected At 8.98 Kev n=1 Tax=Sistotremastrum niveocremeum HHB9708 TaxID=1314777 RepID=A0A164S124_9AGAM|nr:Coriolopsis Gallica laccase collected At 8.98 Kev [Sistotremastrum niveocremeum HHB9708]
MVAFSSLLSSVPFAIAIARFFNLETPQDQLPLPTDLVIEDGIDALSSSAFSTRHYGLELRGGLVAPDGFPRTAVTINNGFAGPLITALKHDSLEIKVNNQIRNQNLYPLTSVHWHGFFQHRTATEDGVGWVTQCPIVPGRFYDYHFHTAGQTGTYWYHSHMKNQYCDGLRGPLVVYDPQDPFRHLYDIDDASTVITLADWYHVPSQNDFNGSTIAPTPDSTLINGRGRYVGGPLVPLSVINVLPNKRYRFRLINISCLQRFTVSLDGHNFTVIEADGELHQPYVVDSLDIFIGQRYSVIVETNQTINNYWFRAVPGTAIANQTNSTDPGLNNAIFRYQGAPIKNPVTNAGPGTNPLIEANLVPLINPGAPGGDGPPDVAHQLTIGLGANGGILYWTINGTSFNPPGTPVLLQILAGATTAQDLLPPGSVIPLPPQAVVQISIPDTNGVFAAHPFHLHGHSFDVIRSAGQTDFNYKNPPRRDVVAVDNGNITFRFRTDNPGPWFLHCHIDWHLNQGLAVVFAEDPSGVVHGPNATFVPSAWKSLCTAFEEFKLANPDMKL